jgi:hypothetical protein
MPPSVEKVEKVTYTLGGAESAARADAFTVWMTANRGGASRPRVVVDSVDFPANTAARRLRRAPVMTWKTTTLLLGSAVLAAAACNPAPVAIEPHSTAQHTIGGWLMEESPIIMLVVADDADTTDAAALRDRVAGSVRAGLLHVREERFGSCGNPDPAAWHPGDVRVIVARPSAPDGAALLTPLDSPALAWITQTSSNTEIDAVVAAATEALGQRLAQPGEVYRPLRAARRALDLVNGARAPESAAETALKASLPEDAIKLVLVASTRDDEDTTPVAALLPDEATLGTSSIAVVGPFTPMAGTCWIGAPGNTRLEAWSKALSWQRVITWPCDDQHIWDGLISTGWCDGGPVCEPWPIAVSADGVADCQVLIDQADLGACDPTHGFHDPGGKATFVDRQGTKLRRCEVAALEGADLQSCRESLDCSGCPSGWCVTEVPELADLWTCEPGTFQWPLRFIGGAEIAEGGWIDITCNVGTAN